MNKNQPSVGCLNLRFLHPSRSLLLRQFREKTEKKQGGDLKENSLLSPRVPTYHYFGKVPATTGTANPSARKDEKPSLRLATTVRRERRRKIGGERPKQTPDDAGIHRPYLDDGRATEPGTAPIAGEDEESRSFPRRRSGRRSRRRLKFVNAPRPHRKNKWAFILSRPVGPKPGSPLSGFGP